MRVRRSKYINNIAVVDQLIDMGEDKGKLSYPENIIQALRTPTGQGIDYEEMAKVLPVIAKVEEAVEVNADYVVLEDAEHKLLADRIKQAKYGLAVQELFDMIKEIVEAPIVPLEDVSARAQ